MKLTKCVSVGLLAVSIPLAAFSQTPTVRIKNRTAFNRLQWVRTAVPFPKGTVLSHQQLNSLLVQGHPVASWTPIKWHYQNGQAHSLAIAHLEFPTTLSPFEEKVLPLQIGTVQSPPRFATGPATDAWLQGNFYNEFFAVAKFMGDPKVYFTSFYKNMRLIRQSGASHHLRFHGNFVEVGNPGNVHPLSMTTYLSVNNRLDYGEVVMAFGNNTFERPVQGGVNIETLDLYIKRPMQIKIRDRGAYGLGSWIPEVAGFHRLRLVNNTVVADGASIPFRGVWGVIASPGSLMDQSFQALAQDPIWGMVNAQSWRLAKAGGITGTIPPPRFTSHTQGVNSVEHLCNRTYTNTPVSYLSYVNQNPGQTGDQADFSSNMPSAYLQAVMTESICPIQPMLTAITRETLRPSYYFKQSGDRIKWTDFDPRLFWWSGRIHYHPSHNPFASQYWQTRMGNHGFQRGNSHGWNSQDNQHFGNHHVRATFELTGDPLAFDLIRANQSIVIWNHIGDGNQRYRWGSERGHRILEDGLELYRLAPLTPTAPALIHRLTRKVGEAVRPAVQDRLTRFNVAIIEIVHDDNRYPSCVGPGNECGVIWQTGFNLSFLASMLRHGFETTHTAWIIDQYMNHRSFHFFNSGQNRSWARLRQPSVSGTGFAQSWLSGWVPAVMQRQQHAQWPWFRDTFIPYTRGVYASPTQLWINNDKWRNFQ